MSGELPFVKQPQDPELSDILSLHMRSTMMATNCHAIATVQSFDSSKQTITATINYKRTKINQKQNGEIVRELYDYPLLVDVPVIFLCGGAFSLKMPIVKGDTCLIFFNDRSIDEWFSSGQISGISSTRLHSLSDGIALVGIKSMSSLLTGFTANMVIFGDGTHDLKLGSGESSLNVGGSRVKVKAKINIQNNAQNLYTLLDNLCTQLQNLTTALSTLTVLGVTPGPSPSGVPANAAAITAIGSQIGTIATNIGGLLE